MFEYELNDYLDYYQLYNDLMSKETTKSKKETTKRNKVTNTNSNGREGLISQMLMDKFDLDLNKDKRFENGRIIGFYEIDCLNEKEELLKKTKIAKIKNNKKYNFEIDQITYFLELNEQNLNISRLNEDDGRSVSSIKSYKSGKSGNKSLDESSIDSTNKPEDQKMEKSENGKRIKGLYKGENLYFQNILYKP